MLPAEEKQDLPSKKYFHYDQAHGEVCTLPVMYEGEAVHAVGTCGCRTCMCVYVQLHDGKVFIAHMVAYTYVTTQAKFEQYKATLGEGSAEKPEQETTAPSSGENYKKAAAIKKAWYEMLSPEDTKLLRTLKWTSEPTKGEQLKQKVLAQLRSEISLEPGKATVVEAFALCPAMLRDRERSNGWWMHAAVKEFFGIDKLEVRNGHGLVAWYGGDTCFLWNGSDNWEDGNLHELPPSHHGWSACNEVKKESENGVTPGPFGFWYVGDRWRMIGGV